MDRISLLSLLISCWTCVANGQTPSKADDGALREQLIPLVSAHGGEVAVTIEHLASGDSFRYRSDVVMPTASLIKLPLMVAVYHSVGRGELNLETPIILREDDKVAGSGILTDHFSAGATMPLRDYVRLMIRDSDNTATNVVIDQVGLAATADLMESLGMSNTKLHSKVYRGDTSIFAARSKQFGIGSTTANEMVSLLRMLHKQKLGDESNTRLMMAHLASCDDRSKLARYLPPGTKIFHKTGAIGNCRTDAGIIETATGPVAVCVLTNKNTDQTWSDENEAELLCSKIGRVIVERFGHIESNSTLRHGSTGLLVEALQRTLNARLDPSPGLSVDGDFGSGTEAAVKRFQSLHQIEPSGALDSATWKQLGALVEETPLAEEVDHFNTRVAQLPKQPSPAIDDPPMVTCKAWFVANGETGAELSGFGANERRAPASTTKIMTAHIVVQMIASDPRIAKEVVTFSENADKTSGSSSALRAGEQVTVSELLYGLMLPSGNDAAIAIAEHFGARLQPELPNENANSVASFVDKMNQTAKSLGMNSTHFRNPNGLPDDQHVTTASDLARLAFAASQEELFRRVVATRQHACEVQSQQGYRRTVVWKNTNQLLDVDGYTGMKTGTTNAAGACLVAMGTRDGKSRIVVVLGSSDSHARYVDAKNLFRWSLNR